MIRSHYDDYTRLAVGRSINGFCSYLLNFLPFLIPFLSIGNVFSSGDPQTLFRLPLFAFDCAISLASNYTHPMAIFSELFSQCISLSQIRPMLFPLLFCSCEQFILSISIILCSNRLTPVICVMCCPGSRVDLSLLSTTSTTTTATTKQLHFNM